ncbi:hypothetical protein TNCV_1608701 [Trichonephila clavipes]|nr:hypothetical protein TNCV_1608701 [Trichonephila clavipes]
MNRSHEAWFTVSGLLYIDRMRVIGEGSLNFESCSSDKDYIRAVTPFPYFHTMSMGGSRGRLTGQVTDSWLACREFETSTA